MDETKKASAAKFGRKKLLTGSGALLAATFAPAIARHTQAQPREIIIANLHPVSGFLAVDGKVATAGAQVAVDEINQRGGVKALGGAQVRLITGDTQGNTQISAVETQRVIRAGAVGVIGAYQSATTLITTQVAEQNKIPHVADTAVADEVTERGFKYTFRIAVPASHMSSLSAQHLASLMRRAKLDKMSVAYMHEDTAFGSSVARTFPDAVKKVNIELKEMLPYSAKATDLTLEVAKLIATKADVIAASTYFGDGVLIARILYQRKPPIKALVGVASGCYGNEQFVGAVGPDVAKGVFNTNHYWNPLSPKIPAILKPFSALSGGLPFAPLGAYTYTAVGVLVDAIERAKSIDKDAIREALTQTDYRDHILPAGPIQFDSTGQNKNGPAAMTQVRDGKMRVVAPEQYAEAEATFPAFFPT